MSNGTANGLTDINVERPCVALSSGLMKLFKKINTKYCQERRSLATGLKYNDGYDDKEGHYIVLSGEEILDRYTVQEVLGKGSFGTVLKCFDEKRQETVAVKITRNGPSFRTQAKFEIEVLLQLNGNSNLNNLVVKLLKVFDWKGHLVLVFELLSYNLFQLIKCTEYSGVSLDLVRKFALQLIQVLLQLESHNPPIVHCDIKPENILLRDQNRSGIRMIDFGSACFETNKLYSYIQSRFYRSPEVILRQEYTTAIDRWSLGCVLVELHTGLPLFDGSSEAAQLKKMQRVLGPMPSTMVRSSPAKAKYFSEQEGAYVLKDAPDDTKTLDEVLGVRTGGPRGTRKGQPGHDPATYAAFADFIKGLLTYEPARRLSCRAALGHPFLAPLIASTSPPQLS